MISIFLDGLYEKSCFSLFFSNFLASDWESIRWVCMSYMPASTIRGPPSPLPQTIQSQSYSAEADLDLP